MKVAALLAQVEAGDWFLPVRVKEIDQHSLIPEAMRRGAAGYFYEPGAFEPLPGVPSQAVPSLREKLFAFAREAPLPPAVAVVAGSNGKTSVKELVAAMARAEWGSKRTFASPANLNTKVHLASQILEMPAAVTNAIFEMGARRPGDFEIPLSYLRPNAVALLNIGHAHRGEFGGEAPQVRTKLSALAAPSARTLVVPYEDERIRLYAQSQPGRRVFTFGFHANSDFCIKGRALIAEGFSHPIPPNSAPAWELNYAAAAALARALGISWEAIANPSGLAAAPGRFEPYTWQGRLVVNDAFNSSPESLRLGVDAFLEGNPGKRLAFVLGSMLELGPESEAVHRAAGAWLRGYLKHSLLFTVGAEAEALGEAAGAKAHFSTAEEAIDALKREDWDAVYLKSSRALGLLGALRS